MLNTLRAVFSRDYTDKYEVNGFAPMPIQECVGQLEHMGFQVDEKLDLQYRSTDLGMAVSGYLAPQSEDVTLIRADVRVKNMFKFNVAVLTGALWVIPSMLAVALIRDLQFFLLILLIIAGPVFFWG